MAVCIFGNTAKKNSLSEGWRLLKVKSMWCSLLKSNHCFVKCNFSKKKNKWRQGNEKDKASEGSAGVRQNLGRRVVRSQESPPGPRTDRAQMAGTWMNASKLPLNSLWVKMERGLDFRILWGLGGRVGGLGRRWGGCTVGTIQMNELLIMQMHNWKVQTFVTHRSENKAEQLVHFHNLSVPNVHLSRVSAQPFSIWLKTVSGNSI